MTGTADESGFADFLAAAADGRQTLLGDARDLDAIERADGEAFCAQVIETALQLVVVDPARPAFVPWQTPTRRYTDNGLDSVYGMAFVDDRHRYRIHGARADECYLSVSLYATDSGQPDRQVSSANHIDLGAERDEHFAFELTPSDGGSIVITRQYFLDPVHDAAGSFAVDVLDGPPPSPPSEAAMNEGWRRAARFVRALATLSPLRDPPPPWVSNTPNTMGDPSGWDTDPLAGRGAIDQIYASGSFALGRDEALVMETRLPRSAYASATVWNRFSQSIDPRFNRSTINNQSAVTDADGRVRVVVSPRDPGAANWLDTGGRTRGSVFWRFLLAEEPAEPIRCQVVAIDAV